MALITDACKPSCGSVSISRYDSNCSLHYAAGTDKTSFAVSGTALDSPQGIPYLSGD